MAALSLLADENVDRQIVALLRRDGHEVLYVAELDPGINDDEVLRYAKERHALLLTADKDFGELVYRQRRLTEGVVLFRLVGLPSEKKAELIAAAIRTHVDELSRAFTVISPGMVRIPYGANIRTNCMILLSNNIADNLFGNDKRHTTFPSPRNCPGRLA